MIKLTLLLFACILNVPIAFSETTTSPEEFQSGPEEGETYYADNAPGTCELTVEKGFNIRKGPSSQNSRCGIFQSTPERPFGSYKVTIIGVVGNWVQISSEDTKNCPGGSGYSYFEVFNQDDFARFRNGECGRSALDGGRTKVAETGTTDVASTNSRGHQFPLDKCLGLKNNGGLGRYGSPRRRGSRRYPHTGTDYYAPRGAPLRSPCEGVVSSSSYGDITGNAIIIKCNNGDSFKFMHMNGQPPKARSGTRVSSGALVGGVGNSGNARGQSTHVHLEAIINGRRVDPQSLWDCDGDSGF